MQFTLGPTTVTKELILNSVSEETLMEHYLGVPVKKGLLKSPLRQDNKPTCAFYRNKKGDLIFKDFRGDFSGNFISVVMYKFQCSYRKALNIIANDFGIISRPKLQVNPPLIKYTNKKFEETQEAIIQIEVKDFEQYELDWWLKFGVTRKILRKFRIFSCKNVFLNGNIFHLHKDKQLVFGYFGGIREDIERWRIYFPGNTKYKFISNWKSFRLQGAHALPKEGGEYLAITKSLKDVACLYSCGITAIAPISENCFVTEAQFERLSKKFKKIILFYDNDSAGITHMNKFRKQFPDVYVLWIPRHFGAKDISDYYKKYGREKTLNLIEQAKLKVNAEEERRRKSKEEEV